MRIYDFHGSIQIDEIGKELRNICRIEKTAFKILTGYGSTNGISKSKSAALRSLSRMKKEGLIIDYFCGDVLSKLQGNANSYDYKVKMKYYQKLKYDKDYGNEGIIFVFTK